MKVLGAKAVRMAAILLTLTAACTATTEGAGTESSPIVDKSDAGPTPDPDPKPSPSKSDGGKPTPPKPPAAACPSDLFAKPACQSCFATQCKAECGSCGADEECNAALTCLGSCTTEACFDGCLSGLSSTSEALLADILATNGCLDTKCDDACAEDEPAATKKTGDACASSSECQSGSCNGKWCADSCVNNVDCGINSSGNLVWCVPTNAGTTACFPGCQTSSDCSAFAGTSCKTVTANNGSTTKVCSL